MNPEGVTHLLKQAADIERVGMPMAIRAVQRREDEPILEYPPQTQRDARQTDRNRVFLHGQEDTLDSRGVLHPVQPNPSRAHSVPGMLIALALTAKQPEPVATRRPETLRTSIVTTQSRRSARTTVPQLDKGTGRLGGGTWIRRGTWAALELAV